MQDREPKDPVKIGIMGCGRLGSQLAHCLLSYGSVKPKDIKVSTRRPETLGIASYTVEYISSMFITKSMRSRIVIFCF